MGKTKSGIRQPLVELGEDYHQRVTASLQQGGCVEKPASDEGALISNSWPTRTLLMQGHLFDSGLINQALEVIEQRGGDFIIQDFSAQPNDQRTEFNFKRTSSVKLDVLGSDNAALDDIISRLRTLVDVMESAEGSLTEVPAE